MSWQDQFAANKWRDPFGVTPSRPGGHRGTDLAVFWVPAWEPLTVETSDLFYANLGYCTILRCEHGYRFGIAHQRKGTRAHNGAKLKPGDKISDQATGPKSLAQSNINFPGLQWGGTHAHITMTRGADPFGASSLLDARPHIIEQVGGGAVDYGYGLTTAAQRDAQRALTKLKLYSGPIDGAFGINSVKGMQQHLKNIKLLPASYAVDGVPGANYGRALQELAKKYGYRGPLDGVPGAETSKYLSLWAAEVNGETVTPPTPSPTPEIPPKWVKTYPRTAVVVPSPNREQRKPGSVIKYLICHGTANPVDHTAYFSRHNEREVAPNIYLRPSGEVKEFVRLGERAWTTGVAADHEAVTVEAESDNVTYTDAQYEEYAQLAAWLSQQERVDNIPVQFTLDRQHILGHKEVPGVTSGTSCPGKLDLDRIVRRAKEIVTPPEQKIEVLKSVLDGLLANATADKDTLNKLLK